MLKNRPLAQLLSTDRRMVSVEFFPPKDEEGGRQILHAAGEIREYVHPDFVSITYGAGGTTRERTRRYALLLKEEYGFEVMPHLTCVGSSNEEILSIVRDYEEQGICNIMALRGDPPKGETTFQPHPNGPRYAEDLVRLIRANFPEFSLGVAGYPEVHPEAVSADADLEFLRQKVAAGGDFVTTQLFYDNNNFLQFVRRARAAGIDVPIIPGLMPIRSAKQVRRFCQHIPAELEQALAEVENDPAGTREVGIDFCYRQMVELMDAGVHAFHLYIMNRSGMAIEVIRRLRANGYLN